MDHILVFVWDLDVETKKALKAEAKHMGQMLTFNIQTSEIFLVDKDKDVLERQPTNDEWTEKFLGTTVEAKKNRMLHCLNQSHDLAEDPEPMIASAKGQIADPGFLRWLRNSALVWPGYKEDPKHITDGIDHNPEHPDNLSHAVVKEWVASKETKDE